jgi:hypothetical protein
LLTGDPATKNGVNVPLHSISYTQYSVVRTM